MDENLMTGASLSHAWFTVLFKLVSSWRTSFNLLDESQTNCNKEMGKKKSHMIFSNCS